MEVEDSANRTLVTFTNQELQDEPNIQALGKELSRLVCDQGRRYLVLDFSNVEFLGGSAALAMLITLLKKMHAGGGQLVLRNLNPHIHELFKITRLATLFDIRQGTDS